MMSFKKKSLGVFIALAACVLPAVVAVAQDSSGNTSASVDVSTAKDTGKGRTYFGDSFAGHLTLATEATVSQEYDDNIFSSNLFRHGDSVSRLAMRFSAAVQKKRLTFQAHYFPNYVIYAKYSDRNALSHQYNQALSYRFSGRTEMNWDLSASRSPTYSNSPFSLVNFDGVVLPVFRPDALQNNSTIFHANSSVNWSHRFSAKSTLKLGVNGGLVRFDRGDTGVLIPGSAQKSFSTGGNVQWDYEIVPRRKIGLQFGESYFGFLDPASHSHYQSIQARFTQDFSRGFHFTVAAGPSRREDQLRSGISVDATNGFAAEAALTKTSKNHTVGLGFHHGAQLGSTQSSLTSDNVSISMQRRLGRRMNANGGFSYSRSSTLNILPQVTNSYAVNSGLGYQFSPELSGNLGYSYVNQATDLVLPGVQGFDRNVFSIGLRYTFKLTGQK